MDTYLQFASNHPLLVTALLASFFLLVFSELRRKASGIVNVEPPAAVKLINEDAQVIDLRSPEAYANGHIVNAKNIPADEIEANQERIGKMKATPVLAVCDAGMTSARAVQKMRKNGMDNVFGLKGGMNAWTQASLPVVTSKKTKSRTKGTRKQGKHD